LCEHRPDGSKIIEAVPKHHGRDHLPGCLEPFAAIAANTIKVWQKSLDICHFRQDGELLNW